MSTRILLMVWLAAAMLSLLAPSGSFADVGWQEVRLLTADGFELAGDFHEEGPGSPSVVLLHQLGSDRSEFRAFAGLLADKGFNVLACDARGHGQSTTMGGETFFWEEFDEKQFAGMVHDIEAEAAFLAARLGGDTALGLVGASIQSSTALVYAARHHDVKALAMLSPGLGYRGIDTAGPMSRYSGRPVFMAASEGDAYSFGSLETLGSIAGGAGTTAAHPGTAHGVSMMDEDPDLSRRLESWLELHLKGRSRPGQDP